MARENTSSNTGKNEYLITEKPLKAVWVFTLPMILGSLFQQVYNMVDSIVVGRFIGQNALAAVGASAALTTVFICIATGAGVGASVLVSRYFGSRDYSRMKMTVSTSMIFFLILSIVLGGLGIGISRPIMQLLNTPTEVLDMAALYLKVYFAGFPFLFMYNILSSMFNSIGKSRIPLYLLIFSSVLNVFLDIWMVASLGMGIFGAAFATLIAQGISAVISFLLFCREMKAYQASYRRFDTGNLRDILRLAIPSIVQQSTVSIGMMLVQSVVNLFGAEALAGYSATMRVENIFSSIFVSIGNAVSPFTAQNLGAQKKGRIAQGYHAALLLDAIFAAAAFVIIYSFSRQIAGLFLGENGTPAAYAVSVAYMRWIGTFFIFMGIKMATDGLLRGCGSMAVFMAANLVNLGIRMAVAMLFAPRYGIAFVWYAVPVGWLVNFLISYFGKGRKLLQSFRKDTTPQKESTRPDAAAQTAATLDAVTQASASLESPHQGTAAQAQASADPSHLEATGRRTPEKPGVPEGFTLSMAVMDCLPVLFFSCSVAILADRLQNPVFVCGAILVIAAGAMKAGWKFVLALAGRKLPFLSRQMRVLMPAGFVLILAGLIFGRAHWSWQAVAGHVFSFPAIMFFLAGAAGIAAMAVFSRRFDREDAHANWIEQGTNSLAQLCILLGILL